MNNKSEFTYGPTDSGVKIVETVSGTVSATKQFVGEDEERDGSGAVSRQFFFFGQKNGSTGHFLAFDHLGSVRTVADASGQTEASWSFDPFGRVSILEGTADVDFGFAGMYIHSRSGLNLTNFRPYSASLGRWISRDPIEEDGGLNLYSYANQNPSCLVDPLGLWPKNYPGEALARQSLPGLLKRVCPCLTDKESQTFANDLVTGLDDPDVPMLDKLKQVTTTQQAVDLSSELNASVDRLFKEKRLPAADAGISTTLKKCFNDLKKGMKDPTTLRIKPPSKRRPVPRSSKGV